MNQFEFNGAFVVELPVGQFTSLAIKMAGYSTPMTDSMIVVLRARGDTGTISPKPLVVRVEKL